MAIVEHLLVDTFGTHIGKHSERLQVSKGGVVMEIPILHLRTVTVGNRGVSLSADVVALCCERGIPIFFVSSRGEPYASLYAAGLTGTVLTRRAQLTAYDAPLAGQFICAIVEAKIHNQATNLKYLAKTRNESAPELAEELRLRAGEVFDAVGSLDALAQVDLEELRARVMGVEGQAAQQYWSAVRLVLPEAYGWTKREGRGATDPINSLLNYGYGMLYNWVEQAITLAGLDPYGGFLHADRPGKPSLVLDLIEEFRQVAIDRLVFGLANRHYNIEQDEAGRLSEAIRHDFADKVNTHLETDVRYENQRVPLRIVIQNQARHLATFLRGERESYTGFKGTY